jgi:hypothetical protein
MKTRNRFAQAVGLLLALAVPAVAAPDSEARSNSAYSFTLVPLNSTTQSWPQIDFLAPYFYFRLTNTSALPDSFRLVVQNMTQPMWFPQVCLRQVCFPDSAKILLNAGASDTVGVNIVPFFDGVGEADFLVASVGDPLLHVTYHVTLYAGTAAVGTPVIAAPHALQLAQNFPNPTQGPSRIPFVLPRAGRVSLRVYDPAGRLVATLVDGSLPAGSHAAAWSGEIAPGRRAPGGVYFYRLDTPFGSLSRRMILLR